MHGSPDNAEHGRSLLPVAAIVLTKNEEAGIADTIKRLNDFSDVTVVDSNSTDNTVEIARTQGAHVIQFAWDGKYPKKKQWALDNVRTSHEWVLLLDADEYPGSDLVSEIRALFADGQLPPADAYDIELRYRFAGRFLRHGHRVSKRSLLNKTRARFPEVNDLSAPGIREVEGHYQPQSPTIGHLRSPLYHDDKDPVSSWFERHNRYSDWEAHLRLAPSARREIASKRSSRGQLFERVPLKPLAFFLYGYIARAGFLDGRAGLDYHLALSTYYWQIDLKTRELKAKQRAHPRSK